MPAVDARDVCGGGGGNAAEVAAAIVSGAWGVEDESGMAPEAGSESEPDAGVVSSNDGCVVLGVIPRPVGNAAGGGDGDTLDVSWPTSPLAATTNDCSTSLAVFF